jgi:hypothetical protein
MYLHESSKAVTHLKKKEEKRKRGKRVVVSTAT